jgi:hypothetical protein
MSQPGDSNNGKHAKDVQSSAGDGPQTQGYQIDTSGVKNTSFVDRSSGFGDGGSGGGGGK